MTDHDTARPDPSTPGEDRQARLLDRYLDDLRHGGDPPPDLDPALMRMARLVSDLAVVSSGSGKIDTQRTTKAQTWEALMRPAMTPSVTPVVIAFPVWPGATIPDPSEGTRPQRTTSRPARLHPSTRLQRWQGQSLGLVATLTLVALVTLSGLAVFLTAPRSDPAPTAMLAGVGDGTPDARSSDEVLLPNVTTCAVEPRSYSQTLQLLEPYLSGRFEPPAAYLDSRQVAGEAELPAGQRPAPATTDRIAAVWGDVSGLPAELRISSRCQPI